MYSVLIKEMDEPHPFPQSIESHDMVIAISTKQQVFNILKNNLGNANHENIPLDVLPDVLSYPSGNWVARYSWIK